MIPVPGLRHGSWRIEAPNVECHIWPRSSYAQAVRKCNVPVEGDYQPMSPALQKEYTVMVYERLLLLKELQELSAGLSEGNKLLLKPAGRILECQFVMGGLVRHVVEIRSAPLVDVLLQKGEEGIIEGKQYRAFKFGFEAMALHVKARVLFSELSTEQAEFRGADLHTFVA